MSDIVLTTLNAKYIHASFGLRYIYANMEELQPLTAIQEYHINQRPIDIAENILLANPKIAGFGVYIWNATQTLQVIKLLKKIRPTLIIIIGGPEVSFESSQQEIYQLADHCITGEADFTFRDACREILLGKAPAKLIRSPLPALEAVKLPYQYYTSDDISNRVVYVEASRGCPFTCEFCLSSLDIPVRQFPFEEFMQNMKALLERGLKQFKFVDRTFNLNIRVSKPILEFFLEHYQPGLFLHFEMIPDRLPEALREVIAKFPKGALQFEVGIQSFNQDVNKNISRKNDHGKLEENFRFLRNHTGVHIHADLIVGLPGEDLESFARVFNRLVELDPQEIQVGMLKRLRGTPIVRHDAEWEMVYSSEPPYEILSNKLIDFLSMQRMSRFSRYWDLCANSGHYNETLRLMWSISHQPFQEFMDFSNWLYANVGQRHGIAFDKLTRFLRDYLHDHKNIAKEVIDAALQRDFVRNNRKDIKSYIADAQVRPAKKLAANEGSLPIRQMRHLL